MQMEIRLFARLREVAGADHIVVELPADPTIADVGRAITQQHPTLAPLVGSARFAASHTFVDDSYRIRPQEELAVIPPVSGG